MNELERAHLERRVQQLLLEIHRLGIERDGVRHRATLLGRQMAVRRRTMEAYKRRLAAGQ